MILSGWGRYPRQDCRVAAPREDDSLRDLLRQGDAIARGNGRAYGDAAMNPRLTLDMRRRNRMLAFDAATGQLVAEAGVVLADILTAFLPRGWFPAVTPGTRFVTLGGMIAADVHGKNHHRDGGFGGFVDWIDLMQADGTVVRCGPGEDLFRWTIGGMGLTGVILRAAFRLRPVQTGWVRQTTIPAPDLAATMAALAAGDSAAYSVAWIDSLRSGADLGRGLVLLGEHATTAELAPGQPAFPAPRRQRSLRVDAPGWLLQRRAAAAFNDRLFRRGRAATALVNWESYFYPLDAVLGWNRIYGRRGFLQFQCVLPPETASAGLSTLLRATAADGQGSFLAVLKRLGAEQGAVLLPARRLDAGA